MRPRLPQFLWCLRFLRYLPATSRHEGQRESIPWWPCATNRRRRIMTGLLQDLRYALRQLRKSPGFTIVVVITLALGIGANTAVFSVIDAVMLRPLPYDQPERLIEAQSVNTHNPQPSAISYPDFFDWRSQNRTLEHLVSYHDELFILTGLERPVQVDAEVVSWDLLPALGIRPELGRGFAPDEEKAGTRVVLISHALWRSQFGGGRHAALRRRRGPDERRPWRSPERSSLHGGRRHAAFLSIPG